MDSSFTIRPRDSAARTAVGRSNVVRTDLSPSQSVNAAEQPSVAHHAPLEALAHEPSLDPQCQSLLDREREERERRRARKDEALLRQKAYGRSSDTHPTAQADDASHADFEI